MPTDSRTAASAVLTSKPVTSSGTPQEVSSAGRAPFPSGLLGHRIGSGLGDELGVLVVLAVLVLVVSVFHPEFLRVDSLVGILRQTSFLAVMAFGMVFLVTMRDFDLSVGGTFAFASLLAAKLIAQSGWNPWAAAAVAVAAAAALGALNGLLAEALRVPIIIITVGSLSLYRGLAQIVTNSQPVSLSARSSFFDGVGGDLLGVPVSVYIMAALCVTLTLVYRRTRFGAQVRAIGSNPSAAAFSGVRIARTRIAALALLGAMVGVASMLNLAYFGSADPTLGNGYELFVIAAVIIGATPLSGGRGTIIGALLGTLILQVIQSGLVFFGVGAQWSTFVTGAVIIGAVALDTVLRRRRRAVEA